MKDTVTPKKPAQTPKPAPAAPPKKEEYPPLPPGQPGNPRQYTPVKVDGRKNPRKKQASALKEKLLLKKPKKGPRTLPPLELTRDAYKDVFRSVDDLETAANGYREECEKTGDMPTLNGFCLFCGGNSSLLAAYIDGTDKALARAAQAVADWIVEQMDQSVINGTCPVNYAQHLAVNQHNRFNSRSYSEGHNSTDINTSGDFTHMVAAPEVIDMINIGPKPVKQIPLQGSKSKARVAPAARAARK
jgi:hypothetical protein